MILLKVLVKEFCHVLILFIQLCTASLIFNPLFHSISNSYIVLTYGIKVTTHTNNIIGLTLLT